MLHQICVDLTPFLCDCHCRGPSLKAVYQNKEKDEMPSMVGGATPYFILLHWGFDLEITYISNTNHIRSNSPAES